MIDRIKNSHEKWDVIIIGGGATGLGAAVDAASRGYKTVLFEQSDFSKGTSSRSTKLVHGGVRYLKQGNISFVLEALRERGLLAQNAPHLVRHMSFIVPVYSWWEGPFYGIGMKLYDRLAGKLGLNPSKVLSLEETLKHIPTIEPEGLRRGVEYYDGQFDDARLAINLAETAAEYGGVILNYTKVVGMLKTGGLICGVAVKDMEDGDEYEIKGKTVVNATGVFTDAVRRMDEKSCGESISVSQGAHIILDRSFLPGQSAIMVPHTDDGRVLFAVPWYDRVIVGTTEFPVHDISLEPKPFDEEIEFLITNASQYLTKHPKPEDVLSVFAGLRPLVKTGYDTDTAAISRDHTVMISKTGLISIAGGKWTTYRKMGEDAIDHAQMVGELEDKKARTRHLHIHGWTQESAKESYLNVYGADGPELKALIENNRSLGEPLHKNLPYRKVEVVWGVRREMARTAEDVLARRTRALILDARASMEIAPEVIHIMAKELNKNEDWQKKQIEEYTTIAKRYIIE
jgi:glycerol-3-phosphate dehydrogenase